MHSPADEEARINSECETKEKATMLLKSLKEANDGDRLLLALVFPTKQNYNTFVCIWTSDMTLPKLSKLTKKHIRARADEYRNEIVPKEVERYRFGYIYMDCHIADDYTLTMILEREMKNPDMDFTLRVEVFVSEGKPFFDWRMPSRFPPSGGWEE